MPLTEGERLVRVEQRIDSIESDVHEIADRTRRIEERFSSRPSWAVTVIITLLSSSCCGLIVALATSVSI